MICNKCGKEIINNNAFCNNCGAPVENVQTPPPPVGYTPVSQNPTPVEPAPVNPTQVVQPQQTYTSNNKSIIIVIIALILIGAIVAVVIFLTKGKDEKEDKTTTTSETAQILDKTKAAIPSEIDFSNIEFKMEDDSDRSKNVEFLGIYSVEPDPQKGKAFVGFKHTNSEPIDVTIYLNYYMDGVRIGSDQETFTFVKPGIEAFSFIYLRAEDAFNKVDLTYKTRPSGTYHVDVPYKESELLISKDEHYKNYIIKYKNSNDKKITGYGSCLYYKSGKLVYGTNGYLGEVKPGEEKEATCHNISIPENLDFDDFKFTLYSLYYTEGE